MCERAEASSCRVCLSSASNASRACFSDASRDRHWPRSAAFSCACSASSQESRHPAKHAVSRGFRSRSTEVRSSCRRRLLPPNASSHVAHAVPSACCCSLRTARSPTSIARFSRSSCCCCICSSRLEKRELCSRVARLASFSSSRTCSSSSSSARLASFSACSLPRYVRENAACSASCQLRRHPTKHAVTKGLRSRSTEVRSSCWRRLRSK
mmetsp:Transcript_41199/g.113273  ORF Transcript_41199/g.113273 Transcript_41199/m.113273 type:complete len:211 (+) Transcript_41199:217-849(+)